MCDDTTANKLSRGNGKRNFNLENSMGLGTEKEYLREHL